MKCFKELDLQRPCQTAKEQMFDLYWLALLLTGSGAAAADVAVDAVESLGQDTFFSSWMTAWARRVVIAKALTSIREELKASIDRVAVAPESGGVSRGLGRVDRVLSKRDVEQAVLRMDVFPRCALVLGFFENVSVQDVAILLDAAPSAIRKAQAIGLKQLSHHLADRQSALEVAVSTADVVDAAA